MVLKNFFFLVLKHTKRRWTKKTNYWVDELNSLPYWTCYNKYARPRYNMSDVSNDRNEDRSKVSNIIKFRNRRYGTGCDKSVLYRIFDLLKFWVIVCRKWVLYMYFDFNLVDKACVSIYSYLTFIYIIGGALVH